ncbi:MAG TPA: hypothetical protein VFM18_06850 [Methanosarcina sp.]|nr:hypothetical protein [Methanosarcina sp.]
MNPKLKAEELVEAFLIHTTSYYWYKLERIFGGFNVKKEKAKACAIIAVEQEYASKIKAYSELEEFCPDVAMQAIFYAQKELEQVKREIEAL